MAPMMTADGTPSDVGFPSLVGSGSPNNVLAAPQGWTYIDRATGILYLKSTAVASNTGWLVAGAPPGATTISGDFTFSSKNFGPVLVDQSDGHTYRVISTAGVLSTAQVT